MIAPAPDGSVTTLCEGCGYTLTGLSADGDCPECGLPVRRSTIDNGRGLPAWEERRTFPAFLQTSWHVLTRPRRFFRTLQTRATSARRETRFNRRAIRFAELHEGFAAVMSGAAVVSHYALVSPRVSQLLVQEWFVPFAAVGACTAVAGITMRLTRLLAGKLTTWEATWRGYRLPREVVRRVLCYHFAQVTVSVAAVLLTVLAGRLGFTVGWIDAGYLPTYVITVGVVTAAAGGYLFLTYWVAMRSVMWANT